jgi:hypothetical protein
MAWHVACLGGSKKEQDKGAKLQKNLKILLKPMYRLMPVAKTITCTNKELVVIDVLPNCLPALQSPSSSSICSALYLLLLAF